MAAEFIIAGWMDYADNRDRVLAAFTDVAAKSRAEPGCLDYVVCADPDDAGRIIVFERWVCEADLVEHFSTPHIAEFRDAIAPYPRAGRDMHRYFIESSEQFESAKVAAR